MRSVARTFILIASTLLAVVLLAAPASAAVCSTPFGSLPKDDPAMGTGEVDTLRGSARVLRPPRRRHRRATGRLQRPLRRPGDRGRLRRRGAHSRRRPVAGDRPAPQLVAGPAAPRRGFSTFRSVTNAGSFEGQTTYGLGVRARLPFRVFTIAGGHGRIVVDVARHWTA